MAGPGHRQKLHRANEHLEELYVVLKKFYDHEPLVLERDPHPDPAVLSLVPRFRIDPPANVSVIVGDFLANIRGALDHLAAALAPASRKRSAKFPIETTDWSAVDATGAFVHVGEAADRARQRFASASKGMAPKAIEIIRSVQPYTFDDPSLSSLATLSSLRNADSHYEVVDVSYGVEAPRIEIAGDGWAITAQAVGASQIGEPIDGLRVTRSDIEARMPEASEAQVNAIVDALEGRAALQLKVASRPVVTLWLPAANTHMLIGDLADTLEYVTTHVVAPLEPHIWD